MGTIGTFPEEDQAFHLVTKLSWILPLTLLIASILDAIFVLIFMKFAHPWKGILSSEENTEKADLSEVSIEVGTKEVPDTNDEPALNENSEPNEVSELNGIPKAKAVPVPNEIPETYEVPVEISEPDKFPDTDTIPEPYKVPDPKEVSELQVPESAEVSNPCEVVSFLNETPEPK